MTPVEPILSTRWQGSARLDRVYRRAKLSHTHV
jgi:hypothetical protein